LKIAYFVHDLNDPAVHRRVRMLQTGGAQISLLGFCRGHPRTPDVQGVVPVLLGQTADARFPQRIKAVAQAALNAGAWRAAVTGADVILARHLETLALATLARRHFAPGVRLIYECLDIHTLMVSPGLPGKVLRRLERLLLRGSQGIMVSSPAFVREHLAKIHPVLPPVILAENKVLASEIPDTPVTLTPPAAPPWRIGWFGVLRCQRSLHALASLARTYPGQVEIVLRGRPALNVLTDFHDVVAATPGMSFHGAYDRLTDLPAIYRDVHLTWAIDFYEPGKNSSWLLPNRIYEGTLYGAVPLALASVETGRWLAAHGAGLLLGDNIETELPAFFSRYNAASHTAAYEALARIPRGALVDDDSTCNSLVAALAERSSQ
jgi:succinoglycan biosynthesis protein ExoL